MNVMRFTVVAAGGTVSFVAPCESLLPLVAGCAQNPRTLTQLLDSVGRFDQRLREFVNSGLAVFDEHNTKGDYSSIHAALQLCEPHQIPVFRVVDEKTRRASLEPVKAGVVIFNLVDRRIVQIHNTYGEVRRRGRVPVFDERRRTGEVYRYELPASWDIVP
ncbi:MAG: hypothetical protein HY329_15515 [Chloroflexi bacterium]|nr:hypothetical protein [Chloroflexota bacterium]